MSDMNPFRAPRGLLALGVAIAATALTTSAVTALARDTDQTPDRHQGTTQADQRIPAQAPNARLAALIDSGGTVIRQKGVRAVRLINTGVYCIWPTAATNIQPQSSVVSVSTEYFYSELNAIQVQWASTANGCTQGRIGVYTLADDDGDGTYDFSNRVGFSIVVP